MLFTNWCIDRRITNIERRLLKLKYDHDLPTRYSQESAWLMKQHRYLETSIASLPRDAMRRRLLQRLKRTFALHREIYDMTQWGACAAERVVMNTCADRIADCCFDRNSKMLHDNMQVCALAYMDLISHCINHALHRHVQYQPELLRLSRLYRDTMLMYRNICDKQCIVPKNTLIEIVDKYQARVIKRAFQQSYLGVREYCSGA